jgi:hypothetical protein
MSAPSSLLNRNRSDASWNAACATSGKPPWHCVRIAFRHEPGPPTHVGRCRVGVRCDDSHERGDAGRIAVLPTLPASPAAQGDHLEPRSQNRNGTGLAASRSAAIARHCDAQSLRLRHGRRSDLPMGCAQTPSPSGRKRDGIRAARLGRQLPWLAAGGGRAAFVLAGCADAQHRDDRRPPRVGRVTRMVVSQVEPIDLRPAKRQRAVSSSRTRAGRDRAISPDPVQAD